MVRNNNLINKGIGLDTNTNIETKQPEQSTITLVRMGPDGFKYDKNDSDPKKTQAYKDAQNYSRRSTYNDEYTYDDGVGKSWYDKYVFDEAFMKQIEDGDEYAMEVMNSDSFAPYRYNENNYTYSKKDEPKKYTTVKPTFNLNDWTVDNRIKELKADPEANKDKIERLTQLSEKLKKNTTFKERNTVNFEDEDEYHPFVDIDANGMLIDRDTKEVLGSTDDFYFEGSKPNVEFTEEQLEKIRKRIEKRNAKNKKVEPTKEEVAVKTETPVVAKEETKVEPAPVTKKETETKKVNEVATIANGKLDNETYRLYWDGNTSLNELGLYLKNNKSKDEMDKTFKFLYGNNSAASKEKVNALYKNLGFEPLFEITPTEKAVQSKVDKKVSAEKENAANNKEDVVYEPINEEDLFVDEFAKTQTSPTYQKQALDEYIDTLDKQVEELNAQLQNETDQTTKNAIEAQKLSIEAAKKEAEVEKNEVQNKLNNLNDILSVANEGRSTAQKFNSPRIRSIITRYKNKEFGDILSKEEKQNLEKSHSAGIISDDVYNTAINEDRNAKKQMLMLIADELGTSLSNVAAFIKGGKGQNSMFDKIQQNELNAQLQGLGEAQTTLSRDVVSSYTDINDTIRGIPRTIAEELINGIQTAKGISLSNVEVIQELENLRTMGEAFGNWTMDDKKNFLLYGINSGKLAPGQALTALSADALIDLLNGFSLSEFGKNVKEKVDGAISFITNGIGKAVNGVSDSVSGVFNKFNTGLNNVLGVDDTNNKTDSTMTVTDKDGNESEMTVHTSNPKIGPTSNMSLGEKLLASGTGKARGKMEDINKDAYKSDIYEATANYKEYAKKLMETVGENYILSPETHGKEIINPSSIKNAKDVEKVISANENLISQLEGIGQYNDVVSSAQDLNNDVIEAFIRNGGNYSDIVQFAYKVPQEYRKGIINKYIDELNKGLYPDGIIDKVKLNSKGEVEFKLKKGVTDDKIDTTIKALSQLPEWNFVFSRLNGTNALLDKKKNARTVSLLDEIKQGKLSDDFYNYLLSNIENKPLNDNKQVSKASKQGIANRAVAIG